MNRLLSCITLAVGLLLSSCGYHLGGLKPERMEKLETFCVRMFGNYTTQPGVAMQVTNAVADAMQRDGTYRMAPASSADFVVTGEVTSISRNSLRTDPEDSYLSTEIELTVRVRYKVIDRHTGETLWQATAHGSGSYFNQVGNVQTAIESALSYAARQAADDIVLTLTTP